MEICLLLMAFVVAVVSIPAIIQGKRLEEHAQEILMGQAWNWHVISWFIFLFWHWGTGPHFIGKEAEKWLAEGKHGFIGERTVYVWSALGSQEGVVIFWWFVWFVCGWRFQRSHNVWLCLCFVLIRWEPQLSLGSWTITVVRFFFFFKGVESVTWRMFKNLLKLKGKTERELEVKRMSTWSLSLTGWKAVKWMMGRLSFQGIRRHSEGYSIQRS